MFYGTCGVLPHIGTRPFAVLGVPLLLLWSLQMVPGISTTKRSVTGASFRRRYYYAESHNFEQSLDVYLPNDSSSCRTDLIVLLTVGSGWMGHQPFIYRGCSWWNSSGPRTIASALQCPCVCIRHRGAYAQLPDWLTILQYCLFPTGAVCSVLCMNRLWEAALLPPVLILLFCGFVKWSAQGSASLDDMVDDVATAVAWAKANTDMLLPVGMKTSEGYHVVFGGYSSGGHVAATLLQRPITYWSDHGLPSPHELFSCILYISGVLAVQPLEQQVDDSTDTTVYSGSRTSSSFSSQEEDGSPITSEPQSAPLVLTNSVKIPRRKHSNTPVWLTNFVCRTVWGPGWVREIPSPLQNLFDRSSSDNDVTKIPHLLVECRHEIFGFHWLDTFFCSTTYAERLQQMGVPVALRQVPSDHWRILASRQLHQAVAEEVPKLLLSLPQRKKP